MLRGETLPNRRFRRLWCLPTQPAFRPTTSPSGLRRPNRQEHRTQRSASVAVGSGPCRCGPYNRQQAQPPSAFSTLGATIGLGAPPTVRPETRPGSCLPITCRNATNHSAMACSDACDHGLCSSNYYVMRAAADKSKTFRCAELFFFGTTSQHLFGQTLGTRKNFFTLRAPCRPKTCLNQAFFATVS